MRAKRRGAATPVKCNIRSRFHQIFLLSGCWQSVKKKSDWSAPQCGILSSWLFSWMGFPFCTQASRAPQVKQMTCRIYADERRPATSLYCFALLLYRVSMVMCAACVHGKSFISFVSLERGTRGITEPQDTQSQTSLWLGPCSESSGSVKVPRSVCTLTASWHTATFSLQESKTGRTKTGR